MTDNNLLQLILTEMQGVKQALGNLEQRMDDRFADFEQRMDDRFVDFEQRMDDRFADFEQRMDDRFADFEQRTDDRFVDFEQRMDDRFVDFEQRTDDKFDTFKADLTEQLNRLERKVDRNHDVALSFYEKQQEFNTEISGKANLIIGQLDMHNNQIALNTSLLKQHNYF